MFLGLFGGGFGVPQTMRQGVLGLRGANLMNSKVLHRKLKTLLGVSHRVFSSI